MMKRLMFTILILSGFLVTAAKAEEFTVLDNFTYTGPFSPDTPIYAEFSSPASAKSIELTIRLNNIVPDRCCSSTRFSITVSLEGQDPVGDWHTLVYDEQRFDNSLDRPIRIFMLARSLAELSSQIDHLGGGKTGVRITYMFGELPRDLRVKFFVAPEPFDPPRSDDLQNFTVSVSGRMFTE